MPINVNDKIYLLSENIVYELTVSHIVEKGSKREIHFVECRDNDDCFAYCDMEWNLEKGYFRTKEEAEQEYENRQKSDMYYGHFGFGDEKYPYSFYGKPHINFNNPPTDDKWEIPQEILMYAQDHREKYKDKDLNVDLCKKIFEILKNE